MCCGGVVTRRPHPLKSSKSHQYGSSFLVQTAPIDASASARYQSSSLCPHLDGGVRLEPVELPHTSPHTLQLEPGSLNIVAISEQERPVCACAEACRDINNGLPTSVPRQPHLSARGRTHRRYLQEERWLTRTHHSDSYRRNTYS